MLEDVADYLIFAPLAASLVVGVVAAFWYAANRPAKAAALARTHRTRQT